MFYSKDLCFIVDYELTQGNHGTNSLSASVTQLCKIWRGMKCSFIDGSSSMYCHRGVLHHLDTHATKPQDLI